MTAITRIKIWLNAFIPDNVPGVTHDAPDFGTVLDGPPAPVGTGGCFRTDNRGFSSDINAPSRMHSEVEILISGPTLISQVHRCSPTHQIECDSGVSICDSTAGNGRMQFTNLRSNITVDPEGGVIVDPDAALVQIDLDAAASNPCLISPDIDYFGTFRIEPNARTVRFIGEVEPFPAFEIYASADDGPPVPMIQWMPIPGTNPFNLVGGPNRAVDVEVNL